MKITLETILNSVAPYRELQTLKLPPRTALDIYKLGKELDRELQTYRDVSKEVYINNGLTETEQGFDLQSAEPEVRDKVFSELDELIKSEVEIKDIKIPVEVLEKTNNEVSPNMIGSLEWMFDFGEEAPKNTGKLKSKAAGKNK